MLPRAHLDELYAASSLGTALVTLNVMQAVLSALVQLPNGPDEDVEATVLLIYAAVLQSIDALPVSSLSADYQQTMRTLVECGQAFMQAYAQNDLVEMGQTAAELRDARLIAMMAQTRLAERLGLLR